jgi:formate-dependent nitrite reductase membrane component NrfD
MSELGWLAQIAANPQSGYGLPPHWGWYIVLYFFAGGLAAGSYFIATMLLLLGDPRDRDTIRLGYLLSFPLVIVCAVLLVLDLGVPSRFWHMMVQNKDVPELLFKWWSISVGSWVLTFFGLFSFVAFVGTLVETGRVRSAPLVRLDRWARARPRPFAVLWGVAGTFFGFFLAGYTGVLVTATSIPVWHNARLLGALFLASAASTSYALLSLLLLRRGRGHADPSVAKLARADRFTIVLELVLIVATVVLLGRVAAPLVSGGFGVVFWLGVVGLGLVVPLILHRARVRGWDAERRAVIAAACVLAGGLLLRFVVVMSPQFPQVALWAL